MTISQKTLSFLLVPVFVFSLGNFASIAQDAPRACRSVHLWWQTEDGAQPEATAFYNELTVENSTRGSYFMACGFSKGYFGIQELGNGNKIALFSVWEPGEQNNPNTTPEQRRVQEIASGKNVRVKRFGGEGTGGQSFYDYDWKIGQPVRFAVFAKPDGPDRTQYAGYIYVPDEHRWQHLATFSTLANGHLLRGYYSFVEDFRRDGESAKEIHRSSFANGWILPANSEVWQPLVKARFTADQTQTDNIDSGCQDGTFFLQTGGATQNQNTQLQGVNEMPLVECKPPLDLPTPFGNSDKTLPDSLRVLAYNVKHGRGNDGRVNLNRTAAVIRRLNPDVVALQEIDDRVDRSGNVNEPEALAQLTGLKYHAFGSFFDYQGGQYGMAVLSRYPLTNVQNLRLPGGTEPRSSLIVTVDQGSRQFRLANVHFYRTEAERLAQAQTLLKEIDEDPTLPTIIAGDFNSTPDSPVLKLFADWQIPAKGDDHFTFASDDPRTEIDFQMFRPATAFSLQAIDVIEEPVASDHRPLTMDLKWNTDRQEPSR